MTVSYTHLEQHCGSKLHRVGAEHHIFQNVFVRFDPADPTDLAARQLCERGGRCKCCLLYTSFALFGFLWTASDSNFALWADIYALYPVAH